MFRKYVIENIYTDMNKTLSPEDFRNYFIKSEKTVDQWKIGVEQEIMGFEISTGRRINYQDGVKPVLEFFVNEDGWSPVCEGKNIIAAKKQGTSITIEPGGQLEISCAPFQSIQETESLILIYRERLREISRRKGIVWYSIGYDPVTPIDAVPWVPKNRYEVMKNYLAQFGSGTDLMMKGSCTSQSNFDYSSESDMIQKMVVTTAFSSIMELLSATSPFVENGLSGFKSYRNHAWLNIDPVRCGFLKMIFDEDFGYNRYIQYIMKVPMLVIERDGNVVDMSGVDFSEFLEGKKSGLEAEYKDWTTQIGAVFPVSRLRNAIETRTADSSRIDINLAQAAFWKGLLYDSDSLEVSFKLARTIGFEQLKRLHLSIYQKGFSYSEGDFDLRQITKQLLQWSGDGLKRIDQNLGSRDYLYLECFCEIAEKGENLAEGMIKGFNQNSEKTIFQILEDFDLKFA